MAGLLDGLGKLGLGNLEGMDLYADKEKAEAEKKKAQAPEIKETDFIFDKTYECPVCYEKIKAKTIKASKARMVRTDQDLRPIYEHIEPLKYDVVLCPHCGYATLARYFGGLTASQIKAVKENISKSYHSITQDKETYTYEDALYRYKLCLVNSIVKKGKASEKAYICLKAGWLLRSYQDSITQSGQQTEKLPELKKQEQEFLKNALDGFISARQTEDFPMCGMDEITVEYLISVLAIEFEKYDIASKLIAGILASTTASSRMKDKARDVKDLLMAKRKEQSGEKDS